MTTGAEFTPLIAKLVKEEKEKLGAILVFVNDRIHVNGVDGDFGPLNLERYHGLKTLAHSLVCYSIKHGAHYNKLTDCCAEIQAKHCHGDDTQYADTSVQELMRLAAIEYLTALHDVAQTVKEVLFDGRWPETMLVLVCGPASPRFGHPAMQYFARLTNCPLEMRRLEANDGCMSGPITEESFAFIPSVKDASKRALFYIENVDSIAVAIDIGIALHVERKVFSQYASMQTDILAPSAAKHLKDVCRK